MMVNLMTVNPMMAKTSALCHVRSLVSRQAIALAIIFFSLFGLALEAYIRRRNQLVQFHGHGPALELGAGTDHLLHRSRRAQPGA